VALGIFLSRAAVSRVGAALGRLAQFVRRSDKAAEVAKDGVQLSREAEKSVRSLQKQISRHEEKLADFKANPTVRPGMENLPDEVIRQQQLKRIEKIEKEIEIFKENIVKILEGEL